MVEIGRKSAPNGAHKLVYYWIDFSLHHDLLDMKEIGYSASIRESDIETSN
jgi:hypothetical protein